MNDEGGLFEDLTRGNTGEFWAIDEPDSPEPARTRRSAYRPRHARPRSLWVRGLVVAVSVTGLVGGAAWAAGHATPSGGKTVPSAKPRQPSPAPQVSVLEFWRTKTVKAPGPVRWSTKTVSASPRQPSPKTPSARPRPTVTVTETLIVEVTVDVEPPADNQFSSD